MSRIVRSVIFASCLAMISGVAMAGGRPPGSSTGFDHPPSNDEIRTRLKEICTGLVSQDKVSMEQASHRCGCYSNGVVKAMTPGELDEMRATGKFSPAAEPKARKYMISCRVRT